MEARSGQNCGNKIAPQVRKPQRDIHLWKMGVRFSRLRICFFENESLFFENGSKTVTEKTDLWGNFIITIPEIFDIFGPQLNTFTSIGILLNYFRRKLLQSEWSKTVSNLIMSRFTSLTKLAFRYFFYKNSTLLH